MRRGLRLHLLLLVMLGCGGEGPEAAPEVPVHVGLVALDAGEMPVVVLEEDDGPRWLPIWIGIAEARSIAIQMEDRDLPRPNTHDLARTLIAGLEGKVERVVVTELRNGTYYAALWLRVRGRLVEIDSRPSDAIAIALRAAAPIFVRASLFDDADRETETHSPRQQIESGPSGTLPATPTLNL
jgi:bifunctional DNase/RNase